MATSDSNSTSSSPKTSRSFWLALGLSLLLMAWMLSGRIDSAATQAPQAHSSVETALAQVQTRRLEAQTFQPSLILQGQLEPIKHLQLRSQISARIAELAAEPGQTLAQGQLILRFDVENRPTQLARAEADLRLREAELRAGERLKQNQHLSETDLLRLRSALANARAERDLMQQQLAYTEITAPFAGLLNRLPVEPGELRQPGDLVAELLDISQLKLIAQVPQQQIAELSEGLKVEAVLLNQQRLAGEIHYLSHLAESDTRSFQLEARLENPELQRLAGSSARLEIKLAPRAAHFLSPALLALDDQGQTGLYTVNADQRVEFVAVELLSLGTEGVWVGGAPEQLELITLGAGFVQVGQKVAVVAAEAH
ncbi:efflux RND transporter periplasmic adaptor subunit [Nitrincola tapanii]|uniref:Efflux RND transporter periplasmic adaptor subunit n=1 Tax=Nitrincola tapanii TaxID=1708751 RepID=A0A5A9W5Z3_9GAMM|nr:efflux RND transporter periplasmic adaptor subunit [Nitrincola tapanii]KAA0874961.1 efflux RND transporter periplasmic adaptor subunit [Nitrincola tapanii]